LAKSRSNILFAACGEEVRGFAAWEEIKLVGEKKGEVAYIYKSQEESS